MTHELRVPWGEKLIYKENYNYREQMWMSVAKKFIIVCIAPSNVYDQELVHTLQGNLITHVLLYTSR